MNCQSFEIIVNDLARDQIMDATVREQALLHSTSCETCAVRFRDEQTLTHGLRELAVLMQAETTPESIEASLVAEFRSRRPGQRASSPNGFLPIAAGGGESRGSYWVYAGVAAALVVGVVIALGVTAVRFRNATAVSEPVESSGKTPSPDNVANHTDSAAPVTATVRGSVENQENPVEHTPRRNAKRLRVAKNTVTVQSLNIMAPDLEVTTDFIPIAFGNASNVQEGGQVVRLELPRYAMARFGVPVNEERYDERVKADVWVGADGFARAIRFVQ
ncbi:MAG: hypothetical protein H7Z16_14390 [Pyrinomonadaceae bacterium]|nr:hypothetical protein [Pyrinomonadaceae bacterium]